jgi:hypothetical protein
MWRAQANIHIMILCQQFAPFSNEALSAWAGKEDTNYRHELGAFAKLGTLPGAVEEQKRLTLSSRLAFEQIRS